MHCEKVLMSAEISGQLICRGIGQNESPHEKTDISSVEKEQLSVKTVFSNKAEASGLFGTSVGKQKPKR